MLPDSVFFPLPGAQTHSILPVREVLEGQEVCFLAGVLVRGDPDPGAAGVPRSAGCASASACISRCLSLADVILYTSWPEPLTPIPVALGLFRVLHVP